MQLTNETAAAREAVCRIARSWLGTPYHHMGRIKGVGVDCAMFPLEAYREAGLIDEIEIPFYPPDWHLHRSDEIYLGIVNRYAREVTGNRLQGAGQTHSTVPCHLSPVPSAGDLVLYQFGRTWSHGAIVLEWPLIIHAVVQHGVILSDGEKDGMLIGRQRRLFSIFAKSKHDTDHTDASRADHADVSVESVASV
jgi:cell wall-associated NlpC family hydrolase